MVFLILRHQITELIAVQFGGKIQIYQANFAEKTFSKIAETDSSNVVDIALSPAGDRLYVLSSNDSGTLSEFRVTQEGLTPIKTTPAVGGDVGTLLCRLRKGWDCRGRTGAFL